MDTIWVLSAASADAVVYKSKGGKDGLHEHKRFEHAQARLHDRELTTDLPGRAYDSAGHGRHAMEQPTDPKRHEADAFARELADYLEHGCTAGACEKLYIVAPPAFLGLLRKHYSKPVQQCLAQEVDLNLSNIDARDIRSRLPEYL